MTQSTRLGWAGWLRLQAALTAGALLVAVVRAIELSETLGAVGDGSFARGVVLTQVTFWLSWSVLAGAIIPVVQRAVLKRPRRLVVLIGVVVVLVVAIAGAPIFGTIAHRAAMPFPVTWLQAYRHTLTHNLWSNLLLSVAILAGSYGIFSARRAQALALETERLTSRLTATQLELLRAELNPHFLFNTLNSIAMLSRQGANAEVVEMIAGLSDLLRHALDGAARPLTPLAREVEIAGRYLAIEKVRFRERLSFSIRVPDPAGLVLVPTFLLQPIVENAVRHGLAGSERPIALSIAAARVDGTVEITVEDDGVGLIESAPSGEGIGLGHTRARLAGHYGDRATLELRDRPGGGTIVRVRIPESTG